MRVPRWSAGLVSAALIAAVFLGGCAAFQGSKRVNVGPFAENTLGMIGELQKFNRPVVWTRLIKYKTLPAVQGAGQTVGKIRVLMRGIAFYSSQIVAVYDSALPEEKKISELARYMEEIIRPNLTSGMTPEFTVTPGYMDTLIRNIRERKTFLSALDASQPLVNMTQTVGDLLYDDLEDQVQTATVDINARIEAEFGSLRERIRELSDMHVASARSYGLLERYRGGEQAALDSLRLTDPAARDFVPAGKPVTPKQLDEAERYVIDRTTTIKSMRDQLEPEFNVYRESQAELEALRNQTDERARLGRVTLIMWCRSHRNLAAGISVPPAIDVMGMMKTTVSTGVKGILP